MELDRTDMRILAALQRDGRMTNLKLAETVGLSPTPCLKRVRKLEQAGVISGYRAVVAPARLGLGLSALVLLRISDHSRAAHDAFTAAATAIPAVVGCAMTTGRLDYLLRILARDLSHYERIVKDDINCLPHIADMETLFILSESEALDGVIGAV